MYPTDPKKVYVRPISWRNKPAVLLHLNKYNFRIPIDQIRDVADALHDIADEEEAKAAQQNQ